MPAGMSDPSASTSSAALLRGACDAVSAAQIGRRAWRRRQRRTGRCSPTSPRGAGEGACRPEEQGKKTESGAPTWRSRHRASSWAGAGARNLARSAAMASRAEGPPPPPPSDPGALSACHRIRIGERGAGAGKGGRELRRRRPGSLPCSNRGSSCGIHRWRRSEEEELVADA
jgi:hypothetical protein